MIQEVHNQMNQVLRVLNYKNPIRFFSASQNEHSGINAKTWKMVVTPPPCRLISIGVLKLLNITYLQGG